MSNGTPSQAVLTPENSSSNGTSTVKMEEGVNGMSLSQDQEDITGEYWSVDGGKD